MNFVRIFLFLSYVLILSFSSADTKCSFALKLSTGKKVTFTVEGRTPAERRFKAERDLLNSRETSGEVFIEWLFHPFYMPRGHTSLRIGNTIYEFAPGGWKIHDSGADNARGFLFNNPFFKRMYAEHRTRDMPPFSVGIPFKVSKSVAYEIEDWIRAYKDRDARPFSYLLHNCNHCMIEALEETKAMTFDLNHIDSFSSLITMRKLLQLAALEEREVFIYPLPDTDRSQLGAQMPEYLLKESPYWREFLETIKSLGNYDGIVETYRRLFR